MKFNKEEPIQEITQTSLIENGVVVPPNFHFMADGNKKIIDATKIHIEAATGNTKIFFALDGENVVKSILDNIETLKKEFPNHTIFTISSNTEHRTQIDGEVVSRQEFMKTMRDCSDAIIFHYDILSEGFDIPGITGVVIDIDMGLRKVEQTLGRFKQRPDFKTYSIISFKGDRNVYGVVHDEVVPHGDI